METVLCCCKHFSNIFWNICSWAVFFWPSRKSHICDRGLKIFPIFSSTEQKALSNDKVSLAFFSNRRNFIFEYICFFQVRFSGRGNYCNTIFVILCHYQVWNSCHIKSLTNLYFSLFGWILLIIMDSTSLITRIWILIFVRVALTVLSPLILIWGFFLFFVGHSIEKIWKSHLRFIS